MTPVTAAAEKNTKNAMAAESNLHTDFRIHKSEIIP